MKAHLLFLAFLTALSLDGATGSVVEKATPPAKEPAKTPVKEKVYELPKTGLNQPRPGGGWINVEAVGTRLIVKFYDKKKKPAAPDVTRGFAQFRYSSKNPERAPLHLEGLTLASTATVRPPHNFLVLLSLFTSESAGPAESHNFKYP